MGNITIPNKHGREQCRSLLETTIFNREGERRTVYLRCEAREGHEAKNHRSWLKKWPDHSETGWLEDDYESEGETAP